ncbi:hypothetical protein IPM09_00060 [Candidatus Saccharibacteria bacterium]|nr:MAG: hypothetical protein IPM09_00060 [Candidatus Saccharibacteria bacterium]
MNNEIAPLRAIESIDGNLQDITTDMLHALLQARERDTVITSHPAGFYLYLPGHTISYSVHDSDCHGHWTEKRSYVLPDQPQFIAKLAVGKGQIQLDVSPNGDEDYGYTTTLTPDNLQIAKFFIELPSPEDSALTQQLHQQLSAQPTVWLTADYLHTLQKWNSSIGVRSAHPISSPVSVHGDAYGKKGLKSTAIVGVQSMYDETNGQTLVQVVMRGSYQGADYSVTDWVPLDDIEFYHHPIADETALYQQLGSAAQALIDGTGNTEAVNEMLSQGSYSYQLVHEQYATNTKARFVLGRVAANGASIDERFIPTVPHSSDAVRTLIAANRVILDREQPWIISDKASLATPLLFAENFRRARDSWFSEHVETWVKEPAFPLSQSG